MKPYQPVSCDFVDQIEIAALQGKEGAIRYLEQDVEKEIYDLVKSWETKDKVEYLITGSGKRIRMDQILWLVDQEGPALTRRKC